MRVQQQQKEHFHVEHAFECSFFFLCVCLLLFFWCTGFRLHEAVKVSLFLSELVCVVARHMFHAPIALQPLLSALASALL